MELKIGCPDSINATVLPQFIEHYRQRYPRVVIHVHDVPSPAIKHPGLRQRSYDHVFARLGCRIPKSKQRTLNSEFLFDDPLVIVTGLWNSPSTHCSRGHALIKVPCEETEKNVALAHYGAIGTRKARCAGIPTKLSRRLCRHRLRCVSPADDASSLRRALCTGSCCYRRSASRR